MKANRHLSISLLALIMLFSAACGTLEVGIEGTATPRETAVDVEDLGQATKAPVEVQPDAVFSFNTYIHPQWGYQLPIPNGAKVVNSPDGLSTGFLYEDANLFRGAYTLTVDVLPDPATDSPEELVQKIASDGVDHSPVTIVEVDGGRLTGAMISYLMPLGGAQCAEMRVLDVAFVEEGTGYILKVRSDAPGRCDAGILPETEGVIKSFRVESAFAEAEGTPTASQEPVQTPLATPAQLRVAFVKDDNVWLWKEGQEAVALTRSGGASSVRISDDGEIVAFVRDDELWAVDSDGADERRLVSESDFAAMEPRQGFEFAVALNRFDWIPGTRVLAFNTRLRMEIGLALNDDLHLVDADALEQELLLPPGEGGEFYYSPDGQQIAVVTAGSISLLDTDGGNRRDVFTYTPIATYSEFQYYAQPTWAADSSSLAVAIPPADPFAQPPQLASVWHIYPDRPSATLMGNIAAGPMTLFAFTPDLIQLAYLGLPEGALQGDQQSLIITDLEGDETVTYYPQAHNLYGWAPDSRHFAFLTNNQVPQAQIGAPGAKAVPAHGDGAAAVIDVSWVDADRYLYLVNSPSGWDILLGEIGGSGTVLAAVAGQPPAYDFTDLNQ